MAVFDIEQQRMCVRVVYDGAASAGKTTNVRQLAELFATQRTCELFSPAEMNGRTLYFDWLQIAAGMACGVPLVCQVISVPGQQVLTPRRRHLLASADVVVHVCDSEEQSVVRAADGLALFDEVERERGERVPLVIQANKQDQTGAVSGPALLAALVRAGVPVVEAIASDGVGVVDTFVAAVRAAVRSIQARVDSGDVRIAVQHVESAAALLEKLAAAELDPEWAIEMLLEEASSEYTAGSPVEDVRDKEVEWIETEPPTWKRRSTAPAPSLPGEDVPTGFIWPAHTGRAALRALASDSRMREAVELNADGALRLALGEFVLATAHERRFESAEGARQALVRAARERTKLGTLLAPETVLVAQTARDDSTWLWTILPRMKTIAELVAAPDGAGAQDTPRATVLAAFGCALADALKVEALHGMPLDLSPRGFGYRHGAIRYVGDVLAGDHAGRDAGRAIADALVALKAVCGDLEPAVAALESALVARLSVDERAKLGRSATWSKAPSVPPELAGALERIEDAFNRDRKAA